MNLTDEQKDIIEISQNMRPNEILKIQACAGSGKTATLIEIARANPKAKMLYTAFNKAVTNEAKYKFPKNVEVKTWHSLAYQKIITNNDYKTANKLDYFDLQIPLNLNKYEYFTLNKQLKSFVSSKEKDFPNDLIENLFLLIKDGEIPYTHDIYLKEFQMLPKEQRRLEFYDFILLDEAQDTNEVQLDIFLDNDCKKIIVGDTYQNIYGFRGTNEVNALEENIGAKYNKRLSCSFRCKQEILDKACFFINKYRGKNERLISKYSANGEKTQAYITRTNAAIIDIIAKQSTEYNVNEYKIKLIREPKELFKASKNILYFENNDKNKISREFKRFLQFDDLDSLKEYAEDDNDIEALKGIELVKKYGDKLFELEKIANNMYETNDFNIILTTAHTAKGLEWDRVVLHNDFYELAKLKENLMYESSSLEMLKIHNPKNTKEKEWHFKKIQTSENKIAKYKEDIKSEANLYYVAITRAKETLIDRTPNNVEWEETMKINKNQVDKFQKIDLCESSESKGDLQNNAHKICFGVEDRKILAKQLKVFFDSSNSIKQESWLNNGSIFIQKIEALLSNHYFVEGKFDPKQYGDFGGSYIVFIRRDMRREFNIKTRWGVYCRVHFSPTAPQNEKIKVGLNFSYINKYHCESLHKMHSYNESNANCSIFAYPNYDMDLVIDKLQQDLNYFLEIPLEKLKPFKLIIWICVIFSQILSKNLREFYV